MNKRQHAVRLLGLVTASLLALACNNDYGIYASIQEEPAGASSGPFYRTSVYEITSFSGSLFARRSTIAKMTGGSWSTLPVADLGKAYSCIGLAKVADTTLHAAIYGKGLYSSTDGSNWSRLIEDASIDSIHSANGKLFISDHSEMGTPTVTTDDVWTLHAVSGGVKSAPLAGLPPGSPLAGLVHDGTLYWAIAGSTLYSAASEAGPFTACVEAGAPSGALSCISSSATAGVIYVGAATGTVYRRDGATPSWISASASSSSFPVEAIREIPGATASILLVGFGSTTAGGGGYLEANPLTLGILKDRHTSSTAIYATTPATNYDTTMSGRPVNDFTYVPAATGTGGKLYASLVTAGITGASGLYAADFDGTAWSSLGWQAQ
ncbi:MAG: hypothetical protein ACOYM2_13205 [Rectinemataceae bacterium]